MNIRRVLSVLALALVSSACGADVEGPFATPTTDPPPTVVLRSTSSAVPPTSPPPPSSTTTSPQVAEECEGTIAPPDHDTSWGYRTLELERTYRLYVCINGQVSDEVEVEAAQVVFDVADLNRDGFAEVVFGSPHDNHNATLLWTLVDDAIVPVMGASGEPLILTFGHWRSGDSWGLGEVGCVDEHYVQLLMTPAGEDYDVQAVELSIEGVAATIRADTTERVPAAVVDPEGHQLFGHPLPSPDGFEPCLGFHSAALAPELLRSSVRFRYFDPNDQLADELRTKTGVLQHVPRLNQRQSDPNITSSTDGGMATNITQTATVRFTVRSNGHGITDVLVGDEFSVLDILDEDELPFHAEINVMGDNIALSTAKLGFPNTPRRLEVFAVLPSGVATTSWSMDFERDITFFSTIEDDPDISADLRVELIAVGLGSTSGGVASTETILIFTEDGHLLTEKTAPQGLYEMYSQPFAAKRLSPCKDAEAINGAKYGWAYDTSEFALTACDGPQRLGTIRGLSNGELLFSYIDGGVEAFFVGGTANGIGRAYGVTVLDGKTTPLLFENGDRFEVHFDIAGASGSLSQYGCVDGQLAQFDGLIIDDVVVGSLKTYRLDGATSIVESVEQLEFPLADELPNFNPLCNADN